jgi:hypothetical protein
VLSDIECRDEMIRSAVALDSIPGSTRSLAYPFGLFSDSTRQIAENEAWFDALAYASG